MSEHHEMERSRREITERVWCCFLGLLIGLMLLATGIAFGRSEHPATQYRDCRKIASIETCVAHVGLEKAKPP